jgi:hypothetical protein
LVALHQQLADRDGKVLVFCRSNEHHGTDMPMPRVMCWCGVKKLSFCILRGASVW